MPLLVKFAGSAESLVSRSRRPLFTKVPVPSNPKEPSNPSSQESPNFDQNIRVKFLETSPGGLEKIEAENSKIETQI